MSTFVNGRDRVIYVPASTKTYTSHARACRYGCVRDAAPIRTPEGVERWIARPFWNSRGGVNLYFFERGAA